VKVKVKVKVDKNLEKTGTDTLRGIPAPRAGCPMLFKGGVLLRVKIVRGDRYNAGNYNY